MNKVLEVKSVSKRFGGVQALNYVSIHLNEGEFLALAVSLEHVAEKYNNPKAQVLANTLDAATGKFLENDKSPSRKVNELDNRGSHFYLCLYWAQELASQEEDADLKAIFTPVAEQLISQEMAIVTALNAAQGTSVDLGGYYMPDDAKAAAAMRPCQEFNACIDGLLAAVQA